MNTTMSIHFCLPAKIRLFLPLLWLITPSLQAQERATDLFLSGGASVGYALTLTYGEREDAGALISVFGELQYQNIMGRLQFTSILVSSFDSENLDGGSAIHGSLGYSAPVTGQFRIPLLLTGGAAFIQYNNGFNGSSGNSFTDVSPQAGITVAPYYQLTGHLSIQGAFRYLKGFAVGNESEAIDLTDVAIGIRFTL